MLQQIHHINARIMPTHAEYIQLAFPTQLINIIVYFVFNINSHTTSTTTAAKTTTTIPTSTTMTDATATTSSTYTVCKPKH